MSSPNPEQVVRQWLHDFNEAITNADVEAFIQLLLPEGWLRDSLIFTWNHRSLDGRDTIKAFLSHVDEESNSCETRLSKAKISNVKMEPLYGIVPQLTSQQMIEGAFTFETPLFFGKAYVLLGAMTTGKEDSQKSWKALSLHLAASDLKGHEEDGFPVGYYDNHAKTWQQVVEEERRKVEDDPHVVILGAGSSGLNIGARFRQMRIPTILIDQCDRVGDVWRKRYPSLTLHTPSPHFAPLYTRLPSNWPKFTPRDKIAHMLESYAVDQELIIWHRSTILPQPVYDTVTKRWTIEVLKDGEKVTLRPYHIVLALGRFGPRYIPNLQGANLFKGTSCHAEEYKGPEQYKGKNVIVVGAAQTASDICLDLVLHDAKSVTMVQRSSTVVISIDLVNRGMDALYPMGGDPDAGDFRNAGFPNGLIRKLSIATKDSRITEQKQMLDGLVKAGLKINEREDGGGFIVQLHATGNKFWIDMGAAEHVINGRIRIKQGEPDRLTEDGVIFKDGSFLEADAVVFGTGYYPLQQVLEPIFGNEVCDRIFPAYGMDEEGEMIKAFRPCGHPGIWWVMGSFNASRYFSKSLAIQIKARLLGLVLD